MLALVCLIHLLGVLFVECCCSFFMHCYVAMYRFLVLVISILSLYKGVFVIIAPKMCIEFC